MEDGGRKRVRLLPFLFSLFFLEKKRAPTSRKKIAAQLIYPNNTNNPQSLKIHFQRKNLINWQHNLQNDLSKGYKNVSTTPNILEKCIQNINTYNELKKVVHILTAAQTLLPLLM